MFIRFFYDTINIIRRAFYYGKTKEPVHRVQMTEGKRNIIHQLLEEYLNKAISALVKKSAGQKANGTSGTTGAKWYIR